MFKTFEKDREFIERKYHNPDEPFNPYRRMAYHGYDFDPETGKTDEEILQGLKEAAKSWEMLPHPVAKAKAMRYVLENTRIDVNEHDYFVGFYSVNRLITETTISKWQNEIFVDRLPEIGKMMEDMNASGAVSIWPDFDHVVPDWDSLLSLGFAGLKERAVQYRRRHEEQGTLTEESTAHFQGIDIVYSAILAVLDRLVQYARTKTHAKAEMIIQCLVHLRDGAPQNIYEAMQLIYIYFMISECFGCYQVRSLGNGLDDTLYGFYKRDLDNGTFTQKEIKEFLAYFLIQWSAIGNYWGQPFYLGGTDKNGNTRYNQLSYDIIDVYDKLEIYNPKIQIKVNHNTPADFLNRIFDMIRRGHSSFVFCCEPGMMKAVMSYGATYDEARDMDIRGCYETGVRANEVSTATTYVNALKPVEYVFSNGYDKRINKQFGLQTGAVENMKSFEEFYHAVLKQWEYLIEMSLHTVNTFEPYLSTMNPSLMYSATIERSLAKGRDAYQNGVKFNNSAILNCGFASMVDAVMAVRELVFEKRVTTLGELKAALDANWEGYELLRGKALACRHKYGCGDAEADCYARAMAAYFSMKVNQRPNARGGVYKAIMHSAMQFVWQGEKTPATPDGRKAGSEISKNASPVPGMDREGVTALIHSAINLRPYTYPESFCVDIMLHPSAVEGEEGLAAMKALLDTYMKNDGMSIQFNVFQVETLKDAQKNPEKYKNLQVRVCGWNVLWNHLSKKEQDAYIERAEHI